MLSLSVPVICSHTQISIVQTQYILNFTFNSVTYILIEMSFTVIQLLDATKLIYVSV